MGWGKGWERVGWGKGWGWGSLNRTNGEGVWVRDIAALSLCGVPINCVKSLSVFFLSQISKGCLKLWRSVLPSLPWVDLW